MLVVVEGVGSQWTDCFGLSRACSCRRSLRTRFGRSGGYHFERRNWTATWANRV